MKRQIYISGILIVLLLSAVIAAFGQEPFSLDTSPLPKPRSYVSDLAGVLKPEVKARIESQISDFKKRSNPSVELGVAIVKTTGDRPIFDYSLAVARGWGIGTRADDNPGALLFIAVEDRKYFTQVSSDLEDELPDGLVGSLQREFLVPQFKKGDYGKGIEDTIAAYIRTIEAKQSGVPLPKDPSAGPVGPEDTGSGIELICGAAICGIVLFVILVIIIAGSSKKSRPDKKDQDRWGGGGFGGSGGGGSQAADIAVSIIGALISGLASGSSSSGGSSGSWGGSSGGGWGGFGGGGDFGGGGAGGGW